MSNPENLGPGSSKKLGLGFNPRTIDKTFIIRTEGNFDKIENFLDKTIENYKKSSNKSEIFIPKDFADYLNIGTVESNLAKCERVSGFLTITTDKKPSILIEKKLNKEKKDYITTYLSFCYLIEQRLSLANSYGLIEVYTKETENNPKNKIGITSHKFAQKMIRPHAL
jgi:hypothetical protein